MDGSNDPARGSLLEQVWARVRGLKKRHVVLLLVVGLAADAAIVLLALWWFGVIGTDSTASARAALQECVDGDVGGAAAFAACLESVGQSTDNFDDRRRTENIEIAARALTMLQARCRTALDRSLVERCADVPVIEGVIPGVAQRIRVEALVRLADYRRLEDEATRLIRFGDGFGFVARALSRHHTRNYAGATEDYRAAIKHFPDDPTLLDNLARAEVSAPPL